ncbi:AAA family ATPase [Paractinoplanes atraurantiacus]|uniref:AAA ATPase domain-containing protein n=1 Tax=Paractinoplanes atraurantiacus TaxID=1036182 RepID=A0A285IB05_9ACTN|nr:AAA family ATPase [Actinoplanes atraurantiacus]SNY45155.1 AAA ATPase domain-containing protein [Actinoplanes atraurantiacus]
MSAEPTAAGPLADAERRAILAGRPLTTRLAICGSFPRDYVAGHPDGPETIRLLCEQLRTPGDEPHYLLAEEPRVHALAGLLRRGGLGELAGLRLRTRTPRRGPLQRMLDAFAFNNQPPLQRRTEEELIASLTVTRWFVEAIALAGRSRQITVAPSRDEIEGHLAVLELTRAARRLTAEGFVGRESELGVLHEYRGAPGGGSLADDPALVVSGVGGAGKSTLISQFVLDMVRQPAAEPFGWAYLDLDRPTLASYEPAVLLREVIRQVGVQHPGQLRAFRYLETTSVQRSAGAGLESYGGDTSWHVLADEFADQLRRAGITRVVVVLDTFEQLERSRHADELCYELFAKLATLVPALRLVVSGRAPARVFTDPARPDRHLSVGPFSGTDAVRLLGVLTRREAERTGRPAPEPDPAAAARIAELVGGLPLTLRLAARVLVGEGPDAVTDAVRRATTLDKVRTEFIRGFLYRRILDQIPDGASGAPLSRIARLCLVLRQITPDLLEQIVLPELGLAGFSGAQLFDELAGESGLFDRDGDTFRLRWEVREPALAALRYEDRDLVERLHRRARDYFAAGGGLEWAYHHLAVDDPDVNAMPSAVLRRLEPSLGDLPPATADAVRHRLAAGDVSSAAEQLSVWERRVLPQVEEALRSGELDQARRLLAERAERSPASPLHRAESRLHESEGDLPQAIASAESELSAARRATDARRYAAAAIHLAALHEKAGDPDAAIAALNDAEKHDLLAGAPAVRLEVLLNRVNVGERRRRDDEDTRWLLELDARALLQRLHDRGDRLGSALLRLLAAALGRDDPDRVIQAAAVVGLGHDEDPQRVRKLIDAVVAWDRAQEPPGALARAIVLSRRTYDDLGDAWTYALAGTGTDAGPVLEQLWQRQPPPPVREALREVYLWWGLPTTSPRSVPQERDLADILASAYPRSSHLRRIADIAGMRPAMILWEQPPRAVARDVIEQASREGRLSLLISAILNDDSVRSLHPRLRALVGEQWLREHELTEPP